MFKSVVVDLSHTESIDSTSLGLLAKLSIQADRRFGYRPILVSTQADITRILCSMGLDDVFNGTAWRGAGQSLRIEAVPGSEVQRYLVNFTEPFLWDTPISFNVSAYLYDRRYFDWDEQRLGGRLPALRTMLALA